MTATRDQLVEAGARALRWEQSNGLCDLDRECDLCDCIAPQEHDRYARAHAAAVLDAVLPLITPPDALCGPVAAQTPETAPTGTRPHSSPFSNV